MVSGEGNSPGCHGCVSREWKCNWCEGFTPNTADTAVAQTVTRRSTILNHAGMPSVAFRGWQEGQEAIFGYDHHRWF